MQSLVACSSYVPGSVMTQLDSRLSFHTKQTTRILNNQSANVGTSGLARQLPTTFRTFPVVMFHDGYYENDMQHLGSINVMTRYEPGFDRLARAVVSQIPKRIYGTKQEVTFHEVVPQNEALTNKILAGLPAPEFKRLVPFF